MIAQTIVGVVLPAGLGQAGRTRANIYLTPRLAGGHLLSEFPDWLHWTRLVHDHGLRLHFASGARTATVSADTSVLRPDIWEAIFSHDSRVEPYPAEDFSQRLVVSYPTRDAHAYLRWAFQVGTATFGRQPPNRVMNQILGDLAFRDEDGNSTLDDTLSQLRIQLWNQQQGAGDGTAGTGSTHPVIGARPAAASSGNVLAKPPGTRPMAERFALYHHLPPAPGRRPLPSQPHELAGLIDFHRALASLSAYPPLLPALGLVFAVELPAALCPDSPASGAYLEVALTGVQAGWRWTHPPTFDGRSTAYVRGPRGFFAAPASTPDEVAVGALETADIVDGFLALGEDAFQLVGVDLDGAILKAMALADSLANAPNDERVADGLLPSLRSAGLSLLADARGQELLRAIRDNQAFAAGAGRALNARDLTRGYRLDVYGERSAAWHSLHRRDGTYRFGDGSPVLQTDDEEGFTQLAVMQPAADPTRADDPAATAAGAPQPGTDLYVNERIARWNGWSLSAPRPGTPLNRSPDPTRATVEDPTAGQPATTFQMSSSFQAHPRTLPSLRFGERYRVRARAVDLAGHSVSPEAAVAAHLSLPNDGILPYYRYEPVPPPVIVLRTLPAPGGSLHQMVIRSHNSDPSLDGLPGGDTDERHIAPPRAAEQLVEHHGMLDDGAGRLRADAGTYQLVTERDRGEIPVAGQDPLESGPDLAVTYFPDPLARGAALSDLPGTKPQTSGTVIAGALDFVPAPGAHPQPRSVTKIPFGAEWPGRKAFRIRLVEGVSAPTWDDTQRVLTIALTKAQVATTALSCVTDPQDLDLLGVWNWILELFEAQDAAALQDPGAGAELVSLGVTRTALTQIALDGGNEFLTPSHPLSFTHAVQQPLGRPTFTRLPIAHRPGDVVVAAALAKSFSPVTAWRSLGSHHAVLLGALQINAASTAAIDLEATWNEWIDDVALPGPSRRRAGGHVERITLHALDAGPIAADGTGQRQVAVYIPEIDTLWFAAPFDDLDGVDTPAVVAAPVHQLGDTKHRVVRYRATASSRFQEYFDPGTACSRTGPGLVVDVPSSARPGAPDVAYVIPTFGWDREVTTNVKTEIRSGNALRVYLHRPWYSSGVGELLGVVLWPSFLSVPTDDEREANKTLITQWGLDPAWQSGPLPPIPALGHFPRAVQQGHGLTLHESPQLIDVAGHPVSFDPVRRLWYCDIEFVNPSAYAPFVRLALVRYQPRSIAGAEVSQVTLTDFAQLTPDRSAALTMDPADPRQARVVVGGLGPDGPTNSLVEVAVQARRPDVDSDLGWAPAPPARVRVIEDVPAPAQPESVLFSATIRFAQPPSPGEFRLVVREFEVLEVDPPETALADTPEFSQRLVYAAILPF